MTKKKPEDQIEADAGMGDNSEGVDEAALVREYAKKIIDQRAVVQMAQKTLGKIRKNAKADGLTLGTLDRVISLMEQTPDEQRVYFSELHEYAEALHIAHVAIGAQLDLLDHTPDPEVRSRDWHAKGFAAATTGKGVPGVPPDECPPEHVNDWLGGWNDGQVKNAPKELVTEPA